MVIKHVNMLHFKFRNKSLVFDNGVILCLPYFLLSQNPLSQKVHFNDNVTLCITLVCYFVNNIPLANCTEITNDLANFKQPLNKFRESSSIDLSKKPLINFTFLHHFLTRFRQKTCLAARQPPDMIDICKLCCFQSAKNI